MTDPYSLREFTYEQLKAMNQQIGNQALQLGVDAANIYLSGLSIVNEGVDWVVTIDEVSKGNTAALVSLVPFISAGMVVIIKDHLGNVLGQITKDVADRLEQFVVPSGKGIAQARARLAALEEIKDLTSQGLIPPQILEGRVQSGKLPIIKPDDCRALLREQLLKSEPIPPSFKKPQAHHDLPVTHQAFFLSRGLDINKGEYGRWVEGSPIGRHQNWTRQFNAEWAVWIDLKRNTATQQEILQKMNDMKNNPSYQ